jgi:hypothetical protein
VYEVGSASLPELAPILVIAIFAFTFFWCVISFVLSRMSGWATLAAAYAAVPAVTPNRRMSWQSALMNGNAKYSGAMTVVADAQMLHFAVFPLLRIGHDPFSVPWGDVRAERRQLLLVERVALTFAQAPGVTMLISRSLMERLAQASGGQLRVPPAS